MDPKKQPEFRPDIFDKAAVLRKKDGRILDVNKKFLHIFGGEVQHWKNQKMKGWPAPKTPQKDKKHTFRTRSYANTYETVMVWEETVYRDNFFLAFGDVETQAKNPFFSQHIMTKEEALPLLSSLSHLVKFLEHSKLSSYQMEKIAGIKNTASALCDLLEEGSSSVEGPAPAPCHMGTLIHETAVLLSAYAIDKGRDVVLFLDPSVPEKLITQETILKRLLFILGRQILDHGQGDLLIHISTRPNSHSHTEILCFSMLDPSGMLNIMEEGDHQHKDNRHTSQTETVWSLSGSAKHLLDRLKGHVKQTEGHQEPGLCLYLQAPVLQYARERSGLKGCTIWILAQSPTRRFALFLQARALGAIVHADCDLETFRENPENPDIFLIETAFISQASDLIERAHKVFMLLQTGEHGYTIIRESDGLPVTPFHPLNFLTYMTPYSERKTQEGPPLPPAPRPSEPEKTVGAHSAPPSGGYISQQASAFKDSSPQPSHQEPEPDKTPLPEDRQTGSPQEKKGRREKTGSGKNRPLKTIWKHAFKAVNSAPDEEKKSPVLQKTKEEKNVSDQISQEQSTQPHQDPPQQKPATEESAIPPAPPKNLGRFLQNTMKSITPPTLAALKNKHQKKPFQLKDKKTQATISPSQNDPKKTEPSKRILLIRDDQESTMLLRALLNHENYETGDVEEGEAALQLLKRRSYDLAMVDVYLPDIESLDFVRSLRAIDHASSSIPLILLLPEGLHLQREVYLEAGINDFLEEPFTLDKTSPLLQNWLAVRQT